MGRYYNKHFDYDDSYLWKNETWRDRDAISAPLFKHLFQKSLAELHTTPIPEYFAERHDEISDSMSHCAVFPDVIDAWKAKGLTLFCAGMLDLTMIPNSVIDGTNRSPVMLFIPQAADMKDPHWGMNTLEHYREILERAAKEEVVVNFVNKAYFNERGLEMEGLFDIKMEHLYMDISLLKRDGKTIRDVPGLDWVCFEEETEIIGRPTVEFTRLWPNHLAHQVYISHELYKKNQPEWDYEFHTCGINGKRQAESFHMEFDYKTPEDPGLHEKWKKMGLRYENHYTGKDWWVTLTPESAFDLPDHKLPLLIIMKETRFGIPSQALTAFQFYYDFIELAAQGEFMIAFYVRESPELNERLVDVYNELIQRYPIDKSRVYITGQSHNGAYALEFARRHPDIIAAAATLCNPLGLRGGALCSYTDEMAEDLAKHDMPIVNINGRLENQISLVPVGSAEHVQQAKLVQRRMLSANCRIPSVEEIIAARSGTDYVSRMTGIPADRTEVRYLYGLECYLCDFLNNEGKWHLRHISIENTPHMIMPQMAQLSWEFIRRFARDTQTGKTIELY